MDGAELWNEIVHVLVPMAVPGIASTLLLNVILAWNEAFWTITLTSGRAGTLTAFISSFSSPQGLFLAKLSAASLLAIAPILLHGLVQPEAAGAWPHLRGREMMATNISVDTLPLCGEGSRVAGGSDIGALPRTLPHQGGGAGWAPNHPATLKQKD
jgi:hypothetical protein